MTPRQHDTITPPSFIITPSHPETISLYYYDIMTQWTFDNMTPSQNDAMIASQNDTMIASQNDTMTPYHHDTMTPWHQHKMTPWHHDTMTPTQNDTMTPRQHHTMTPWHFILQAVSWWRPTTPATAPPAPDWHTAGATRWPTYKLHSWRMLHPKTLHSSKLHNTTEPTTHHGTEPNYISEHWTTHHSITALIHTAHHSTWYNNTEP